MRDFEISTGRRPGPRRTFVYGVPGIGKSSFASEAPNSIFVPTEDRLGDVDCKRFPLSETYEDFLACLAWLYEKDHAYQYVCVDSVDWLERLIHADVCREKRVATFADIEYQKGPDFAMAQWRQVLTCLKMLRDHRSMGIILIAHADVVKFNNPHGENYDQYQPRIHKKAAYIIKEWCDEILFANYKVYTTSNDEGFGKKKTRGTGDGERVLHTSFRPAHEAKNSLNMPPEIPFVKGEAWAAYAKYLPAAN